MGIIVALGTIATGIYYLAAPRAIKKFTGLDVTRPRGVTEIRAVMGGVFITVGFIPFFDSNAYIFLGILYLGIGVACSFSMVLDKSIVQSNIISLAVEIISGGILLIH